MGEKQWGKTVWKNSVRNRFLPEKRCQVPFIPYLFSLGGTFSPRTFSPPGLKVEAPPRYSDFSQEYGSHVFEFPPRRKGVR